MSRNEEPEGNMRITGPDDGRARAVGRFLLTLVIIIAIVMVGLCFLVPREGVKSFIEGALSDRMGIGMTIDSTRIGLPYVLVLQGPVSEGFQSEEGGGFKAREIRIGLGWKTRFKVRVEGAVLRLAETNDDTWVPAAFGRLGPVPVDRLDEVSRATEGFRRKVALIVTDGTVRWVNGVDGGTTASAHGVRFGVEPAGIPDREMYYHRLSVDGATHPDGAQVRYVEREWLASDTKRYVEIHGTDRGIPRSVQGFWNPPDRHPEEEAR
jgi:hypothetical protein